MKIEHSYTPQGGHFFVANQQNSLIAELTYTRDEHKNLVIEHTWVDDSLRGQGVAYLLLEQAVLFARQERVYIVPICSYAVVMLQRHHQQWSDVITSE